ncbi:MAG: NAD(P)(+) transhydrogenase (Re/Si-specific) subunit beta [Saprospiraceae bacterium]
MTITALALILGVLLVIPIGGADMPVVICFAANSYSGMAVMYRFVVQNNLLIVAGAIVGASGIILTLIMCKAMNRSVANVFLGGFGAPATGSAKDVVGEITPVKADGAYLMLEAANSVVIVPGYDCRFPGNNTPCDRTIGEKRNRSKFCNPPGCRSYARPHERTAG